MPQRARLARHHRLGRTLGAHEENRAAIGRHPSKEVHRLSVQGKRLLQVDDVDLVALPENVGRHSRVPEAGLVTEVHSGLQHFAHGDICHEQWPRERVGLPSASRIDPVRNEGTRMGI